MGVDPGDAVNIGKRHEVRFEVRAGTVGDRTVGDAPEVGGRFEPLRPIPCRLEETAGVDIQFPIERFIVGATEVAA